MRNNSTKLIVKKLSPLIKLLRIALFLLILLSLTSRLLFRGQNKLDNISENENTSFLGNEKLCILIHGLASGPQEMIYLAEFLHERGYSVKNILLKGHYTKPADLVNVSYKDWLLQIKQEIDKIPNDTYTQVYLIGFSMGALLAIMESSHEKVTAVISISPSLYIYNKSMCKFLLKPIVKTVKFIFPIIPRLADDHFSYNDSIYVRQIYDELPLESVNELFKLADDTKTSLTDMVKPLLLIHAADDLTCDVESTEMIYINCRANVKEKYIIPSGGHLIVLNDQRNIVFNRVNMFLKKY